jgi:hypothetical protein
MAHTIALISDVVSHMIDALVVVALLFCPLVLLVMVCDWMVDLVIFIYTFFRNLHKPPMQIGCQDLQKRSKQIDHQEPDNDKIYSGDDHDIQKPPTQIYARNTLMGLPSELRLMIYDFALQANIDSIVCAPPSPLSVPVDEIMDSPATRRPLPFLGGLALQHTDQIIRKESLHDFLSFLSTHKHAILRRDGDLHAAKEAATDAGEHDKARLLSRAWFEASAHYKAVQLLWDRGYFCRFGYPSRGRFGKNARVAGKVAVAGAEDHKSDE